jgi:hypothetical protein
MSFYTDVIQNSPAFNSTIRISDPALLEPKTRAAVQTIVDQAQSLYGIRLVIFETYRSQARQTMLFQQHQTQLKVVGVHHYGLACDLVKEVGGDLTWKGDYSFLAQLARTNDLISGADWGYPARPHNFVDADHVQRCPISRQAALFAGTWYPGDDYDPYSDL